MTRDSISQEFVLVAACCRWPLSEDAIAAIRTAHTTAIDWRYFQRIVKRQRVFGLVYNALLAAGIDVPSDVAQELGAHAQQIARQNLLMAAETVRLQRAFDAAGIPVLALKGVSLAKLAYGSLKLKHGRDIDLLVPADRAEAALQLLEHNGYALVLPAKQLSAAQRRAVVRYGKEVEFVHRGNKMHVELQWRVTSNPLLLQGVDAHSPTQSVAFSDGVNIRTLAEDDLFAYLCAHGAHHDWSRLKWLADLNALITEKEDADIVRLYRHAQGKGAGLCAGQALLLCRRLFAFKLPAVLDDALHGNSRLEKLAAIAMRAMLNPDDETDRGVAGVMRGVLTQFLLGQGWAYFVAQARIESVGLADVISVPLSPPFQFFYPILRLPLWIWRRGIAAGTIRRNRQRQARY
jgi:hypothetical protein